MLTSSPEGGVNDSFSHFSKSILVKVFNRRETIRLASPPFVFGNILKPTDHAFGRLGWTLASCFITVGFDFPNCVLFQERRERPPSSFLVLLRQSNTVPCRDARLVSSQRASVPVKATPHPVGTHRSCVRPHQSNTVPCRDARLVRPLYQRLQHRGFNGDRN